jgi:hypothetical protein
MNTITVDRAVLEQALQALKSLFNWQVDPDRGKRCSDAIAALEIALAQGAQQCTAPPPFEQGAKHETTHPHPTDESPSLPVVDLRRPSPGTCAGHSSQTERRFA